MGVHVWIDLILGKGCRWGLYSMKDLSMIMMGELDTVGFEGGKDS